MNEQFEFKNHRQLNSSSWVRTKGAFIISETVRRTSAMHQLRKLQIIVWKRMARFLRKKK